ncbi:MAG: GNAT family N-acetyltransferase [Spirosomataceae bacterium]
MATDLSRLETDRLSLRRFTQADFDLIHALHTDPAVMQFIKSPDTPVETQAYLDRVLEGYQNEPLVGRMAVIEKASGVFVGIAIVKYFNESHDIEIGYLLNKTFWRKGYATELTRALIQYCFDTVGAQRVVAVCMTGNEGSWRVMEKAGMRRVGFTYLPQYQSHDILYEVVRQQPSPPLYQTPLYLNCFATQQGEYLLTTDKSLLNLSVIFNYLHHESYWAKGIPMEKVERSFNNSLTFGIIHQGQQIAYARVISDFATFAYLADVFVLPAHRGQGLSKWMVQHIMQYPDLQGLRRWILATQDAHGLYAHYGFELLSSPERWMHIFRPYQS